MQALLETKELSRLFALAGKRKIAALNQVSLAVQRGETLGIVGESGCGKSTLARVIMGIYPPSSGQVLYAGEPLRLKTVRERRAFAKKAQMVFQDPATSLDARMKVGESVAEGLEILGLQGREGRQKRVAELLEMVGLDAACAQRYPHEFSGGQRQRIGIARALAPGPELLICDEPISALDVSVQSQVMNLLQALQKSLSLTCLFIAHDLAMVRHISDRIAVMYAGMVVEMAEADRLCTAPLHPYTQLLLESALPPRPTGLSLEERALPKGETAVPFYPITGCPFAARCPKAGAECGTWHPVLAKVQPGHLAACCRLEW